MILLILTMFSYADEPNVIYKKETTIDFESVEVEGQLKKPQGALVSEKNRAIFNPLVQIREEWTQEMIQSLDQIH